ncbi:hypothetical protein PSHT_12149 [Puccinia striiformis]|uniref:Uncharacterized protein n=1 Tax=Puccinia striiformis TaxID=27350 RepID=A0A2S4UYI8_9BASI|nr:hypothetical protein PSHT_12149 [Puccinia striiformis]
MHFSKSIVVLSIVAIGFINGNDDYDKGNIRVFSCPMWSTDTLPRFPVCARVIERTNEPVEKGEERKAKTYEEGAFQLPAENDKVQVIKLDAGIVRGKCQAGTPYKGDNQ